MFLTSLATLKKEKISNKDLNTNNIEKLKVLLSKIRNAKQIKLYYDLIFNNFKFITNKEYKISIKVVDKVGNETIVTKKIKTKESNNITEPEEPTSAVTSP